MEVILLIQPGDFKGLSKGEEREVKGFLRACEGILESSLREVFRKIKQRRTEAIA